MHFAHMHQTEFRPEFRREMYVVIRLRMKKFSPSEAADSQCIMECRTYFELYFTKPLL